MGLPIMRLRLKIGILKPVAKSSYKWFFIRLFN